MAPTLDFARPRTDLLAMRPWRISDAQTALRIYSPDRTHRSSPSTAHAADLDAMRALLDQWAGDDATPVGRWAVERRHDHRVIGGASLLPLPPGDNDLEIAWQLDPAVPGADGHGAEIAAALAAWAFDHSVDEVFAVVRPTDTGTAASIGGSGLRWVGETTKYFGLDLHVYRLRPADLLDEALPRAS